MANTWTTTRSLHSGFKRSGADLMTTMTSCNADKERIRSCVRLLNTDLQMSFLSEAVS